MEKINAHELMIYGVYRAYGAKSKFNYNLEKHQLELIPLTELSGKDFKVIKELYESYHKTKLGIWSGCKLEKQIYKKQIEPFITDKLRELGYDCGYGSIPSLIDANIAIANTKK